MSQKRLVSGFCVVVGTTLFASTLAAATLFPKPIHLVRKVDDSLAGTSVTVDEYCAGNRVVSVRGQHVTIVDYDKQEMTEIDHAAGTYAVTRFDEVAKAHARNTPPAAAASASSINSGAARPQWRSTPLGTKASKAGRSVESVELVREGPNEKLEIGIDRQVALSREAVEVLIGSSYPNARSDELDMILGAAAPARNGRASVAAVDSAEPYGLPAEQMLTVEMGENVITLHSSILSVGQESVPPELLIIDAHAKRVDSHITRINKELEDLDRLPSRP